MWEEKRIKYYQYIEHVGGKVHSRGRQDHNPSLLQLPPVSYPPLPGSFASRMRGTSTSSLYVST